MMAPTFSLLRVLMLTATTFVAVGVNALHAANTIKHDPVHVALPGQSIAVRATIVGETPRSVSLFFTPSRDVAPFRLPMRASGEGVYAVTIPELNLAGLREVYYYIEARDLADNAAETPWYTVTIQMVEPAAPAAAGATKRTTMAPATAPEKEQGRWVMPTLIGAGILAAGGIAYAVADNASGDDDDAPSTPSAAGTYTGTETTCIQRPDTGSSCASDGFTLTIDDQGVVKTSDLRDGTTMQTTLSASAFVLVASYDQDGFVGEIQYVGNVVDQRVVGSIQGSASGDLGTATFSGSFSGVKR